MTSAVGKGPTKLLGGGFEVFGKERSGGGKKDFLGLVKGKAKMQPG